LLELLLPSIRTVTVVFLTRSQAVDIYMLLLYVSKQSIAVCASYQMLQQSLLRAKNDKMRPLKTKQGIITHFSYQIG
jgi:hypothetical protein